MMRPVVANVSRALPDAPVLSRLNGGSHPHTGRMAHPLTMPTRLRFGRSGRTRLASVWSVRRG